MSDWIEAAEQATTRLGYEASSEAWAFLDGARWMREALLSDESIERAALGIHASHDRGDWDASSAGRLRVRTQHVDLDVGGDRGRLEEQAVPGLPAPGG